MKIPQCPKNMKHCPEKQCPEFPCWAFNEYESIIERQEKQKDSGWE